MNRGMTRVRTLLVTSALLASVSGCMSGGSSGGNIFTATAKIAGGSMTTLTGTEVQILASTAEEFAASQGEVVDLALSDEQADVIVEFLVVNQIDTVQDLQAVIEQAQEDPDSIVIPDGALELFSAGAFDPQG